MPKKDSKKFLLTDVGWPGTDKRAKAVVGGPVTKGYKFDLPTQPQRKTDKPIGALNPWNVWRPEKIF